MRDWVDWHTDYDDAGSALSRRLTEVQAWIRAVLDRAAPGPVRVVSLCAGQGHDILGVLRDHPRRADVTGRLVELDPRNAEAARRTAPAGVEVVTGDAAMTGAYAGAVPADLVLACGIFGNISDADIVRTIGCLPQLCAPGATVIWTRHTEEPDLTPSVRRWFAERGFEEVSFTAPAGTSVSVGAHRLVRAPEPLRPGVRMFTFAGEPIP